MKKYKITDKDYNGFSIVEITDQESQFAGTEFIFGTVAVKEEDDQCILSYDYTAVNSNFPFNEDNEEFSVLLGDILVDILKENNG